MASRTPTKQQGRQHQTAAAFASPLNSKDRRHSVNAPPLQGEPSTVALRQEQSSPAVITGAGDGSLIKQVVSASGQGCAAVVVVPAAGGGSEGAPSARSGPTIWRTRSVRSKAESYCILHLKGASQRGVTVQVGRLGLP